MQIDQQDPVKLVVTFSSDVNLDVAIAKLSQNYLFIQLIKKHGQSLLISFDCMTDLLEIDFIGEFGALHTEVKNSNSFCKEMSEKKPEFQPSTSVESSFCSQPTVKCLDNSKDNSQKITEIRSPKRERLTSLEDQILEQQELIKKFALFDYNIEAQIYVQQRRLFQPAETQIVERFQDEVDQGQKKSVWGNLVGGALLTSLIVGGVKALRFFMG